MQRFTPANPCPICGGHKELPQGEGRRCFGFLGADRTYAHCTRPEHAGPLDPDKDGESYAHRLGPAGCKCGATHGAAAAGDAVQFDRKRPKWTAITPVPENAPDPTFKHYKHKGPHAGVWAYRDTDGSLLGYRVRFNTEDGGKDVLPFSWCRDENPNTGYVDSWQWKGIASPHPLYRLNDLAAKPDADVLVVEGEGKADKAAVLFPHLAVVSCAGGSNGPKHTDWSPLEGRRVINWRDNDADGLKHVAYAAGPLKLAKAAAYHVVQLPDGLPPKWDLGDEFPDGFTLDAARKLIDEAPIHGRVDQVLEGEPKPVYRLTEGGNAKRLVDKFGENLRYSKDRDWMAWDGKRWVGDGGDVQEAAKAVVGDLFAEAETAKTEAWNAGGPDHSEGRDAHRYAKDLAAHAKASDKANAVKGALTLASSDPVVRIDAKDLDGGDPVLGDDHRLKWVLNGSNGTVDLRTGELRPHDRKDLLTKISPIAYDPAATCPTWERFVLEIMGGNRNLVGFLQRIVGYSLTGSTREQIFLICYGKGSNGKTVFLETLAKLLGDYAEELAASDLVVQKFDNGSSEAFARVAGARFVTANETGEGQKLAEDKIKTITGADTIVARFLYQGSFSYKPQFKLWLRTNYRPKITGTDEGIWRRIRLIPFTQTFTGERKDSNLPTKLDAELPGILAWAIRGCLEWQQNGLQEPEEVLLATSEYRNDMDGFSRFLQQLEIQTPTHSTIIFEAYQTWCTENAETELSLKKFGGRLTDAGWGSARNNRGQTLRTPPSKAVQGAFQWSEPSTPMVQEGSDNRPAPIGSYDPSEPSEPLFTKLAYAREKDCVNGEIPNSHTHTHMGTLPTNGSDGSDPSPEPAPPQAPNLPSNGSETLNHQPNGSDAVDGPPATSQNLTPETFREEL